MPRRRPSRSRPPKASRCLEPHALLAWGSRTSGSPAGSRICSMDAPLRLTAGGRSIGCVSSAHRAEDAGAPPFGGGVPPSDEEEGCTSTTAGAVPRDCLDGSAGIEQVLSICRRGTGERPARPDAAQAALPAERGTRPRHIARRLEPLTRGFVAIDEPLRRCPLLGGPPIWFREAGLVMFLEAQATKVTSEGLP